MNLPVGFHHIRSPFKIPWKSHHPAISHLGRRAGGDLEDRCRHEGPGRGDGFVVRSADLRHKNVGYHGASSGGFTVENAENVFFPVKLGNV